MKSQPSIALAVLALSAGAALAQPGKRGYWGDPGLDPRVAASMQPPIPVDWQCEILGAYDFDANMSSTARALAIGAMDAWMFRGNRSANITFVRKRDGEANYIHFYSVPGSVSSSSVGMIGGAQTLNQGTSINIPVICHELCHALGFSHEQSRPDRDSYVTINLANVSQTACNSGSCNHNFNIRAADSWPANGLNTSYDFDSVMHYFSTAFSTTSGCGCADTSCATIIALPAYFVPWQCAMGQQTHLSTGDEQDMMNVYGARSHPLYYVDPTNPNALQGTLSEPYTAMTQVPPTPGGCDVWIAGSQTCHVPAGTQFSSPATWHKHSSGPVVITAP
jgi:hypothetical protein